MQSPGTNEERRSLRFGAHSAENPFFRYLQGPRMPRELA
jgi:hypothetical protein